MLRDLSNKVAWITGAGTGIGEGAAVALSEAGMRVVLSGRRIDKLEEVASRCSGEALIEILDVADKNAVSDVAEKIIDRFGRLDVLVASAGINVKNRNWHDVSLEDWDSVIRIDLDGAFYCCKAVLPTMKKQREGLIINISSWAGKHVSEIEYFKSFEWSRHIKSPNLSHLIYRPGLHSPICIRLISMVCQKGGKERRLITFCARQFDRGRTSL